MVHRYYKDLSLTFVRLTLLYVCIHHVQLSLHLESISLTSVKLSFCCAVLHHV